MAASLNQRRRTVFLAANTDRLRLQFPSSLLFACILSFVVLRPVSAFQLQTATACDRRNAFRFSASSSEGSRTDDPANTTSDADMASTPATSEPANFGESVPFVPLTRRGNDSDTTENEDPELLFSTGSDGVETLENNRMRSVAVAVASFAFACLNYAWQFTHPVTAIEILASMEKSSAPLTAIGNNGKPTVIDFWAPWCENCKVAAPTLKAVEEEYADRVNFITVNGDDGANWPLIQLFGVDSIPHLALLSGEGDVETALIGPMSRNVLRADLDALLEERDDCKGDAVPVCRADLPYTMFDAFGNRQASRRINFVER